MNINNMQKIDYYKHEFDFEHGRCQGYFDLTYRIIQFTFALIVALLAMAFSNISKISDTTLVANLTLQYLLPIGLYVFGLLYAHNIYCLTLCGEKAEFYHRKLYEAYAFDEKYEPILKKYVITDRRITILSYGVPIGFYSLMPISSCLIAAIFFKPSYDCKSLVFLPYILYLIFIVIFIIVVINIFKAQNLLKEKL